MKKLIAFLKEEQTLKYLPYIIIAIGMLLRILVYWQNNSMFIDEANIARNIFERNLSRLAQPLAYEQYAPPVFLWIVKACTMFFGYAEQAYRLYPLLCGLASLWMLFLLLKKYTDNTGLWYGILLFATGYIYVNYSAITKQYMPDVFFTLWLTLLALNNDIRTVKSGKLFMLWAFVGSLAIWASMPSVFILASVGLYYFIDAIKAKQYKKLWFIFAAGAVWIAQFVFYYYTILQPQIDSAYLQNCHKDYFFYTPVTAALWQHDLDLLYNFFSVVGGHQVLSVVLNGLCIVTGAAYLLRRQTAKALLVIVPVLLVLIAGALRQYTLIARVVLFAMPLLLVLIAVGMERLLKTKYFAVNVIVVAAAVICFFNFNALKYLVLPMENEEMKQSLHYLQHNHIAGSEIYVHDLAQPAYVYYTQVHPDKLDRTDLLGGKSLSWTCNYDSLAQCMEGRSVMLYSWEEPEKLLQQQAAIRKYNRVVDSNIVTGGKIYIYEHGQ